MYCGLLSTQKLQVTSLKIIYKTFDQSGDVKELRVCDGVCTRENEDFGSLAHLKSVKPVNDDFHTCWR